MSFLAGPLRENVTADDVVFVYTPDIAYDYDATETGFVHFQGRIEPFITDDDNIYKLELPYRFTLKEPDLENQIKNAAVSLTESGILTVGIDKTVLSSLLSDEAALTITATLDDTAKDYAISYGSLYEYTVLEAAADDDDDDQEGGLG